MTATSADLVAIVRDVEQHLNDEVGWDQPTQMFALVPTAELIAASPELAGQLDAATPFTPIAQEELPGTDLSEALATIEWPAEVAGCVIAQEIMVAPPGPDTGAEPSTAAGFREARLVAAVLRDGPASCALRLRDPQSEAEEVLLESPDLAPNLLEALRGTFVPSEPVDHVE